MTGLRETAEAVARTGTHPVLTAERLFATERIAAELDAQRMPLIEPWEDLVARVDEEGFADLADTDLRRLVDGVWREAGPASFVVRIVEAAAARGTRSCDRALIHAYLLYYPHTHRAFTILRAAAEAAARRHDWAWRINGTGWRLWEPEGPATVTAALSEGRVSLADIGFVGALRSSLFLTATGPTR